MVDLNPTVSINTMDTNSLHILIKYKDYQNGFKKHER